MNKDNELHRYFDFRESPLFIFSLLMVGLCFTLLVEVGYSEDATAAHQKSTEAPETESESKSKGKWLPIPIFITEPAIGYGLGAAVGYFHPEKNAQETTGTSRVQSVDSLPKGRSGQKTPPTVTGAAGGYTNKDTWVVGVGHTTNWLNDTIRYAGVIAYADVNSSFYIRDEPIDFDLKGALFYQDVRYRLGRSQWFLGGKLSFLSTETAFDTTLDDRAGVSEDDFQSQNVGLAAEAIYDSRDNVFTPNTGQILQFDIWRFDEAFGGDYNYWKGQLKLLSYYQLHKKFVLGVRIDLSTVDGKAPFYAYPYVVLRGIPALRYQGRRAGTIEAEGRWNILSRWSIVGFFGSGAVEVGDSEESKLSLVRDDIYAGGVGVRYFLMQDHGLWLGVDVAHGPEDLYAYITVGSAW